MTNNQALNRLIKSVSLNLYIEEMDPIVKIDLPSILLHTQASINESLLEKQQSNGKHPEYVSTEEEEDPGAFDVEVISAKDAYKQLTGIDELDTLLKECWKAIRKSIEQCSNQTIYADRMESCVC